MTPPAPPKAGRVVQQKTPAQKQALEAAFLANNFPDDTIRKALAAATNLTESQVNTWFSHRRRRERERIANGGAPAVNAAAPRTAPLAGTPAGVASGSAPGSLGGTIGHINGKSVAAASGISSRHSAGEAEDEEASDDESEGHDDVDPSVLDPGDRQRLQEYDEILLAARATLGVPYREDGPPLGLEFDEIPTAGVHSGAGGGAKGKRRKSQEDPDFSMDDGNGKRARLAGGRARMALGPAELEQLRQEEETRASMLTERARQQVERLEASIRREHERINREKEKQNTKMAREREKELARLEAERRRHLERVLREQRKEEERRAKEEARMRAMQEKEEKRLALARERELKAEEKRREKEERKREREVLRAVTQQERQAMRQRDRSTTTGPKDDLDVEWDALISEYRQRTGLPLTTPAPVEGAPPPEGYPPLPERPQFPPAKISMPPALVASKQGESSPPVGTAGPLLSAWATLSMAAPVLGIELPSIDDLVAAVAGGISSKVLGDLHIALLRLLQADAEESFAQGEGASAEAKAAANAAAAASHVHLIAPGARLLEEAWAWGFDVDFWRAHLNALTWPEVAREVAISAGLGRRRPEIRKELARMGREGEDVVVGEKHGKLELRLPARLGAGTVKGAAWLVLKDAGHEGLHVEEIARRMQHKGLRDLRTSKTPEASGEIRFGCLNILNSAPLFLNRCGLFFSGVCLIK